MAELKCIESGCSKDAQYIDGGYSYCQEHYRAEKQGTLSASQAPQDASVYLWGIILRCGVHSVGVGGHFQVGTF
jgi:hypothetical protein